MAEIKATGKINPADLAGISSGELNSEKAKALSKQQVKSEKEVEKAASGFEALILQEMFKSMWSTVETTGLMGEDSNSAQIYTDMFHQAVADSVSKGPGMGLKQFMKRELVKADPASKSEGSTLIDPNSAHVQKNKRLNEVG